MHLVPDLGFDLLPKGVLEALLVAALGRFDFPAGLQPLASGDLQRLAGLVVKAEAWRAVGPLQVLDRRKHPHVHVQDGHDTNGCAGLFEDLEVQAVSADVDGLGNLVAADSRPLWAG